MILRRSQLRRPASLLPLALAAALLGACAGASDPSTSGADPGAVDSSQVALAAQVDLFPMFDYSTGLLPEGAPVQASFTVAANGSVTVSADAVASGPSSSATLTGLPGSGKLGLHGGFRFDGQLKVSLPPPIPAYDGPIPGIEDLKIDVDGDATFDPFAKDSPATVHAAIPATKLPAIPLPGGLPGHLVFTIEDGSFMQLDLSGTCAGVDAQTATYAARVDRSGTLLLKPTIEIEGIITQSFDLPEITLDLALGGSDLVMTANVGSFAAAAPEGQQSHDACGSQQGATTGAGAGGAGGATGAGGGQQGVTSTTTGSGGASSSSGAGASGPSSSSTSSSASSSASTGAGGQGCSAYDGDAAGCVSAALGCGYVDCGKCVPTGTPHDEACPCSVHDGGDTAGCDADPHHCAYYNCSNSCWPFGTPYEVSCPCAAGNGNSLLCALNPLGCSFHDACDACTPPGTSEAVACGCGVHSGGDVAGCDADPHGCAYYFCSNACLPAGTPIEDACPQ